MAEGKRKRGRPPNNPPTKLRGVYLTEEQIRLLRIWGRGDASAGLRWLIDTVKHCIRKRDTTPPSSS